MSTPDPITISVIQHRLTGIVEEMGEAMLRTSFSQILNSSRDFSTAICAADSQLVAQADHIPVHVGALQPAAEAMNAAFADDVHPGDIFLLNDPYFGGSHLPDVTVFAPVFVDAEACLLGDQPRTSLRHRRRHLRRLQCRRPRDLAGRPAPAAHPSLRQGHDPRGHPAPAQGQRPSRPRFRGRPHGPDRLGPCSPSDESSRSPTNSAAPRSGSSVNSILDATEAQARAIIAEWQDGTYFGEAVLDDDGRGNENIAIRARITVAGSDLTVDLRQSDPQLESFLNSAWANTRSAVLVALAVLLDPDIPKNEGVARPTRNC